MLVTAGALFAGGLAGANYVKQVATAEAFSTRELLQYQLSDIVHRLERIERKLDNAK